MYGNPHIDSPYRGIPLPGSKKHDDSISILFDRFKAEVKLYESPKLAIVPNYRNLINFDSMQDLVAYRRQYRYYGGIRLIEAIIVRFKDYCDQKGIQLEDKNFTIEYGSTIPFGVGLGGSSKRRTFNRTKVFVPL